MRLASGLIFAAAAALTVSEAATLGCSKEPVVVASKVGSGNAASEVWTQIQELLGEGIAMGPERLGTTLHDRAATARCITTMERLRPQVEKLRAAGSFLGAVNIDDLSACASCASGGDEACSRASAALDRGSRP